MDRAVEKIGGYVDGNVITSVVCGVAALFALLILGVPFAVPLAMWAGLADLIPRWVRTWAPCRRSSSPSS